jgi:hypothetical protein
MLQSMLVVHVHGVAWQPFNAAALLAVLQNILVSKQQKQKSCCQVFGVLNILFGILQFCKIVQELNKAYAETCVNPRKIIIDPKSVKLIFLDP